MFVIWSSLFSLFAVVCSYIFLKSYQLNGYKIGKFLEDVLTMNLKINDKNKLVFTSRMIRYICFYFVLLFGVSCLIFVFVHNLFLLVLDILVICICLPIIMAFVHMLTFPLENLIKRNYVKKATKILHEFKGVKIAITASYGKTSIKNILKTLLEDDFKVVATPKNFNTPMGVCKTVFENLEKDTQVLIVEMGARHKGDIKELTQMVNPDVCVVGSIGLQHIETFLNINNILETKNELIKHSNNHSINYFNGANEYSLKLFDDCNKQKVLVNEKNAELNFENVSYKKNRMNFDIYYKGKKYPVKTKLLGEFNCENIVLAVAICLGLGVEFDNILKRIEKITPAKSRLELIEKSDFLIIDDSYNANTHGTNEGLNVLQKFLGKRIVITSGIVELGQIQYEKNYILGKKIAESCDIVLIMNETNKKAILNGLLHENFDKEKICFAYSRKEQTQWLKDNVKSGCVVLFQNDLPDNFK